MVKGWLPLVALYKIIKLGGFENLRNSSKVSEKWGYEYRSPSLTHKFVFVFAVVRSRKPTNEQFFRVSCSRSLTVRIGLIDSGPHISNPRLLATGN